MKTLLRNTVLYSFALYLLESVITGFRVAGGLQTLLLGGFTLTLLSLLVKPILNILSIPLNVLTLGIFSVVTNVIILYLLTVFITDISIHAFTFHKTNIFGIILPTVPLNHFWAFVASAMALAAVVGVIDWLFIKE